MLFPQRERKPQGPALWWGKGEQVTGDSTMAKASLLPALRGLPRISLLRPTREPASAEGSPLASRALHPPLPAAAVGASLCQPLGCCLEAHSPGPSPPTTSLCFGSCSLCLLRHQIHLTKLIVTKFIVPPSPGTLAEPGLHPVSSA